MVPSFDVVGGIGCRTVMGYHIMDVLTLCKSSFRNAGIEKHIEDQNALRGGYFPISFEDKDLRLKLVRVHTEYLAIPGPWP
jgi:hypothetical protein